MRGDASRENHGEQRLAGRGRKPETGTRRLVFGARDAEALVRAVEERAGSGQRIRVLLADGAEGDRLYLAHRIANALSAPLVEVSVPQLLRETAKSLETLLERARRRKAVLLLVEADALFTKKGRARRPTSKRGANALRLREVLGRHRRPILSSTDTPSAAIRTALEELFDVRMALGAGSGVARAVHLGQHFQVILHDASGAQEELALSFAGPLATETDVDGPGPRHRPSSISLRRAIGASRVLFAWRQAILDGKSDRRTVDVILLDRADGEPIAHWILEGAWPVRWTGPVLDGLEPSVATEEVELLYDRLLWIH